jgi:hypothetical protein
VAIDNTQVDQELKKILQKTIIDECGDLFQYYDFRLVKLVAEQNFYKDCYSFVVGIMSPRVEGGNAIYISHDLTRTAFYNLLPLHSSSSIDCGPIFLHLFHLMARKIRNEIEQRTKDMPMITAPNPFDISNISASNTTYFANIPANIPMQQVRVLRDDITSFSNPIKKPASKFEHITSLVSETKKRLCGGYTNPSFAFEYF